LIQTYTLTRWRISEVTRKKQFVFRCNEENVFYFDPDLPQIFYQQNKSQVRMVDETPYSKICLVFLLHKRVSLEYKVVYISRNNTYEMYKKLFSEIF
jgi:hypothetical protein